MPCVDCGEFLVEGSGTVGSGTDAVYFKTICAYDDENIPLELISAKVTHKDGVVLSDQMPDWFDYIVNGQSIDRAGTPVYQLCVTVLIDAVRLLELGAGSGDVDEVGEGTYTFELIARVVDESKPAITCTFNVCITGEVDSVDSARIAVIDQNGAIWSGFVDDVITKISPDGTVVWTGTLGSDLGITRELIDGFDSIVYLTEEGGTCRVKRIDFDGDNESELYATASGCAGPSLSVVNVDGTPEVTFHTTSARGYVPFTGGGSDNGPNVGYLFCAGLAGSGTDLVIVQTSVDMDLKNYQDWSDVTDGPNLTFRGIRTDRTRERLFAVILDTGDFYLREYNPTTLAQISSDQIVGANVIVLCGVDTDLGLAYFITTHDGDSFVSTCELDGSNYTDIINLTDDYGINITNTSLSAILL